MAKNVPSYSKYFVLPSLLVLVNLFILKYYIFSLTTTTERAPIFAVLVAFDSVIITAIGILYQVEANNKREIKFKGNCSAIMTL